MCNDEWTPEFIDRLGWLVSIKNQYKKSYLLEYVLVFIDWEKPFEDISEYKFTPSVMLMSLHHQ